MNERINDARVSNALEVAKALGVDVFDATQIERITYNLETLEKRFGKVATGNE